MRRVKGPQFDITTYKMNTTTMCYVFSHSGTRKKEILSGLMSYAADQVINTYAFNAAFKDADGSKMLAEILLYIGQMELEFKKQMDKHYRPQWLDHEVSLPKRRRVDAN